MKPGLLTPKNHVALNCYTDKLEGEPGTKSQSHNAFNSSRSIDETRKLSINFGPRRRQAERDSSIGHDVQPDLALAEVAERLQRVRFDCWVLAKNLRDYQIENSVTPQLCSQQACILIASSLERHRASAHLHLCFFASITHYDNCTLGCCFSIH